MKAASLPVRPGFSLMTQCDIQSFYHMQMPRWLFFDPKYNVLPLEAKVAYTFLLNRFQLSKLNGWVNPDGEVFIIYTRDSLAAEMQISYRKVIEAMKSLAEANLIWERRCGRGEANQIYLAKVELTESTPEYDSAPFVQEDSRHTASALLEEPSEAENVDAVPLSAAKTCENGTSGDAYSALQDLPDPHPSNTNKSYIEGSFSPSVGQSRDGQADELDQILEQCELWVFEPETARVFESAIERLYYSRELRIGGAVLPQTRVRARLRDLDDQKLRDAEHKLHQNTEQKIRNTTAYVMAVIFNSITETESDLLTDPYLNSLSRSPPSGSSGAGRRMPP